MKLAICIAALVTAVSTVSCASNKVKTVHSEAQNFEAYEQAAQAAKKAWEQESTEACWIWEDCDVKPKRNPANTEGSNP